MPVSIQEITDYQMSVVLSSTKEDLEKLTEIELTTISDILSKRKNNKYIQPRVQELLEISHYLMMQDSERERKQAETKEGKHYSKEEADEINKRGLEILELEKNK